MTLGKGTKSLGKIVASEAPKQERFALLTALHCVLLIRRGQSQSDFLHWTKGELELTGHPPSAGTCLMGTMASWTPAQSCGLSNSREHEAFWHLLVMHRRHK